MMTFLGLPGFYRALFAAIVLLLCQPALASKRVALVIGNAAYQNAPTLPNPVNDGAVIAATLKDAGFDVVDSRHDLAAVEMRRALRDFSDRARDADIAVIYYAGHGLEVDGNNYLIPVDAKLERDADVYDEGLSLDRVLVAIEPAKQLRLVILDACRDNPFAKTMKRTLVSRSIERGLAKVEPSSPNTLIAYSAKAGSTAMDGDTKNSPFTIALSKHLTTPGLDVRRAFGFVRDDVLKTTGNRQEPFVYGSLGGEDVPLVPGKPAAAAAAAPVPNPQIEARHDYELALQIGNKDALNAFLAQHPEGYYANLARIQLAKVDAEAAQVAATEKAKLAEQERARLAADSAQSAQQLKVAEAQAKAAEQARIDAEKAKQLALDQAADAERKRIAAESSAAASAQSGNRAANNNAPAAVAPAVPPAPEPPKQADVAALTPGQVQGSAPQADVNKSVQMELRRVGCLNGSADGEWNSATQRSLSAFNRNAGTKLDVKTASLDTLDTIKKKDGRVCPLACDHGFRADGDHCSKIVCADGSFLNDDNECEKRHGKTPVAKRDSDRDRRDHRGRRDYRDDYPDERAVQEAPIQRARPPRISARDSSGPGGGGTGQMVCGVSGCHAVARGCHIEFKTTAQGGPIEGGGGNVQVCN